MKCLPDSLVVSYNAEIGNLLRRYKEGNIGVKNGKLYNEEQVCSTKDHWI